MPGYQTKQERIPIAGADDLIIRSLLDRQQYSDPRGHAARLGISSAAWPLFGLLWPSGARLAARLAARVLRPGERILELGCGLALASLVGHRRGADVTASDCHPLAAPFLWANLRLNSLPPMKYRHRPWAAARSAAAADARYDLLLGSDLLYERDDGGALAGHIGRHAAAVAEVWIVDPDRGNRAAFNRRMADLGFALHEERLDTAAAPETAAYKGRLLTYRRGA
jgi:predicted nicotinamide N-methyase